jgi:hypothetical protein
VAVRLQQILLRRPARQQRHETPFLDKRHVLRRNAFVVDDVSARDRPTVELLEGRGVACRKRIGQNAQPDTREKRSRLTLPLGEPRVLGVWRASRQRQRDERLTQQLSARLSFNQNRTGELFPDRRGAPHLRAVRQRGGARYQVRERWQIFETAFSDGEQVPDGGAVVGLRLGVHAKVRRPDGRNRFEAFAVQIKHRAVGL